MTGMYSHQVGVGTLAGAYYMTTYPGYRGFLKGGFATVADELQSAGYYTVLSGKWHLGAENMPGEAHPADRGFDRAFFSDAGGFYGPVHPVGNNYPRKLWLDKVEVPLTDPWIGDSWYVYI